MKKNLLHLVVCCLIILGLVKPAFPQLREVGSQAGNKCIYSHNSTAFTIPNNSLIQNGINGIEMWVYIPTGSLSSNIVFVEKGTGYPNYPQFCLWHYTYLGNKLVFAMNQVEVYNSDGADLTENTWTHIAVTWRQHNDCYQEIKFYINGQQSGSTIDRWIVPTFNTDVIIVGVNTHGLYVDEVRFWKFQPSQAEIAANRFVSIGDGVGANTGMPLNNLSSVYQNLISSYTFNYQSGSLAMDDIGGYNGDITAGSLIQNTDPGKPIPYNQALYLPGSMDGHIRIASAAAFNNLTSGGTLEAWVYPISTLPGTIIQKDASTGVSSYCFATWMSKLYLQIGSGSAFSSGASIPTDKWSHVAVTWSKFMSNYDVDFYLNGQNIGSSLFAATMNTSTSDVWIGDSQANSAFKFNGYLDEVRMWSTSRAPDSIKAYMFSSCRNINNPALVAAYNFDGNLLNFSRYSLPGATFNLPGSAPNACRFSGYLNESTTGAINNNFVAYPTSMNYGSEYNYFRQKFKISAPNLALPDQSTVYDSIMISGIPGVVNSVEVMVNIHHTYISDLGITITAPNGVSKVIFAHTGTSGKNLFTVFNDATALTTSSAGYYPPYTPSVKPDNTMGNFGSSVINGKWKISVTDAQGGDVGILLGWGLKINDLNVGINGTTETASQNNSLNYPNPFNNATKIKFTLPEAGYVSLKIYDFMGKELKTLVQENLCGGDHEVVWDAAGMKNGTYYYCVETKWYKETKKMVLIK